MGKVPEWRRVAGLRVVMTWPQAGFAPPPRAPASLRASAAGLAGVLLIIAGATAVGVGTALFYDPMACKHINEGIRAYLTAQGLASVSELVGTLRTARDVQDCAVSG